MSRPDAATPLALDRPDAIARFRDALTRLRYDEPTVLDRIGVRGAEVLEFSPRERHIHLHRTRGGDPLAAVVRLFLVGVPVPVAELSPVAGADGLREWESLGLVALDGPTVRREVSVVPSRGLLFAYDVWGGQGERRPDHVMGVAASTLALADVTVRRPAGTALDLGCGSGAQALFAASHCGHVLATDANPRALGFTRFNSLLNGLTHVECVEGDLYEPVEGRTFDLIVSNPPFVVSPERDWVYRDGGLEGDEVSARVLAGAPALLNEGGMAHFMFNCVVRKGESGRDRVAAWVGGKGCDAWVVRFDSDPVDLYADRWLSQDHALSPDEVASRFGAWLAYYESLGIESIDSALITLRKRTSGPPNWLRHDAIPPNADLTAEGVLRGFAGRDVITSAAEPVLLASFFRVAPDLRVSQTLGPTAASWNVESAVCRLTGGPPVAGEVDQATFHILTLCRGQAPLGGVLAETARRLGRPPEEAFRAGLAAARKLIDQGFLVPAPAPED